jgi:two-component system, cell cycle response regulator DivK
MVTAGAKTILIVDDTVDTADLFAACIELTGYKAVIAYDGSDAVEQALRYKPDLILMDLRMPTVDGYEATRRILAIPGLSETPIVAVTAHTEGEWRRRALAVGCVACISKPLSPEQLNRIVERYAGGR